MKKEELKQAIAKDVNDEKHERKFFKAHEITLKRGHKLWEVDIKNREVRLAEYEKGDIIFTGKGSQSSNGKLIVRDGCFYTGALNAKNALKNARKGSNGSNFDPSKPYLKLAIASFKTLTAIYLLTQAMLWVFKHQHL